MDDKLYDRVGGSRVRNRCIEELPSLARGPVSDDEIDQATGPCRNAGEKAHAIDRGLTRPLSMSR